MFNINKNWIYKETFPTISSYCTTYNCMNGGYPFEKSILSFLDVSDEVVVVDGGSNDGTKEVLDNLSKLHNKIKVYTVPVNLDNPGKDGELKAMSRAMTSMEYCIQFDVDEIRMGEPSEWKRICKDFPENIDIYNLLVVEPLGRINNIRNNKEHNPWKWRISRNKPEITHGIPDGDRLEDNGRVYSKGASDGCFPVHVVDNRLLPSYNPDYIQTLLSFRNEPEEYKKIIEKIINIKPWILHLGHVDLENKIKLYLKSWHQWWCYLYNKDPNDPQNNQYFPGVKIEDVTAEMITNKVEELIKNIPSVQINLSDY